MKSPIEIWRNGQQKHSLIGLKGTLVTWTKIPNPTQGFEFQSPIYAGIIELQENKQKTRMALQIVDVNDEQNLQNNPEVITVIRKGANSAPDGIIEYVIKAKLV